MAPEPQAAAVVADVRVGDSLEALYVIAREAGAGTDVLAAVKSAAPQAAAFRRTANGVVVPPASVEVLRNVRSLDLRWTPEAERFVDNRRRAYAAHARLVSALKNLKEAGVEGARELIADSEGFGTLDGHQVLNVAAMTLPAGFGLCVFDEQGAGKTVTLIYAFDLLAARDETDRLLVIAPKSV